MTRRLKHFVLELHFVSVFKFTILFSDLYVLKGEQALILRETAGKVSATMNTKPMQAKVAEFL